MAKAYINHVSPKNTNSIYVSQNTYKNTIITKLSLNMSVVFHILNVFFLDSVRNTMIIFELF